MQTTVNSPSGVRWPIPSGKGRCHADDELHLLIELRNHNEIQKAYGDEAATQVLQRMHQRMVHWGGHAETVHEAFVLAMFQVETLVRMCGSHVLEHGDGGVADSLEMLQARLANDALHVRGQYILPVVVIHEVGPSNDAALRIWRRERPSAPHGVMNGFMQLPARVRSDEWFERYRKDMLLAWQWQKAVGQGRVSLVLQPVRHSLTGQDLYHEALLRVQAELKGHEAPPLSAGETIPALERLGLIRSLDRLVMSTVIDRLEVDSNQRLGCNLSALSLTQDSWWGALLQRLKARPDVAARLMIEVTETMPLPDYNAAVIFLGTLKTLGCRIALDDIGSGYGSLGLAREIRPEVIKVDAALLHAERETRHAASTLEKLVGYCRTLAPHVVLEGVEQAQDLASAQRVGGEWLQGYAIAMPAAPQPAMHVLSAATPEMSCA